LAAAAQVCTRIAAAEPGNASAWTLLGAIACDFRQYDRTVECFNRAIALTPDDAAAHYNLANAWRLQGNLSEAVRCYSRALQLNPNLPEAYNNLGTIFLDQGLRDQAIDSFRRALGLNPTYTAAHSNLGNALREQGNLDESIHCHHQALALDPQSADVHNNLGSALKDRGELVEAIDHFRRASQLQPDFTAAWSNLLYTLRFCEKYDAAAIDQEHRSFDEQCAASLAASIQPHPNNRDPNRRLRIGYVSPDFRHHCQAFFTLPLLSNHDHQQFEIFCYSDVAVPDNVTERIQSFADVWRNTQWLDDEQVAAVIRQDQIDILIDLTMHMAGGRPLLFARKPVPIQTCWLAYPGTTGLSAMDYRLTDPYLDPPHKPGRVREAQRNAPPRYAEESVCLPDSFWCYNPLGLEPPINPLPAATNGYITFGSLNNFCKVNSTVLRLWAGVLRAVDHSRLIMLAPEGLARQRTLDAFTQHGITPDRITFVANQPLQQYLAVYNSIDIGLDTVPANGHTTTLDSVWMGVPVVTLVGQTAIGRGGLSQLTNLGLTDLIARSPDDFISIAAKLAADLPRLANLRTTLRDRLRSSPLMDAPRFARSIESAFRSLWRRWCLS
jgi:predicted O-linked N-acetylglucosamine transferase (SPINDLY family)